MIKDVTITFQVESEYESTIYNTVGEVLDTLEDHMDVTNILSVQVADPKPLTAPGDDGRLGTPTGERNLGLL